MRVSTHLRAHLSATEQEVNAWLGDAEHMPSPHFSERAEHSEIDLIVLHCISLPEGSDDVRAIHALFQGNLDTSAHESFADLEGLRVSAHVLIDRTGKVYQYVPFDKAAWHAGDSSWRGRTRCNDFSIGIELQGTDDTAFEQAQYARLGDVIGVLMSSYPRLGLQSIVGHCHVAPGRKQDPGRQFDWSRLMRTLTEAH